MIAAIFDPEGNARPGGPRLPWAQVQIVTAGQFLHALAEIPEERA